MLVEHIAVENVSFYFWVRKRSYSDINSMIVYWCGYFASFNAENQTVSLAMFNYTLVKVDNTLAKVHLYCLLTSNLERSID